MRARVSWAVSAQLAAPLQLTHGVGSNRPSNALVSARTRSNSGIDLAGPAAALPARVTHPKAASLADGVSACSSITVTRCPRAASANAAAAPRIPAPTTTTEWTRSWWFGAAGSRRRSMVVLLCRVGRARRGARLASAQAQPDAASASRHQARSGPMRCASRLPAALRAARQPPPRSCRTLPRSPPRAETTDPQCSVRQRFHRLRRAQAQQSPSHLS